MKSLFLPRRQATIRAWPDRSAWRGVARGCHLIVAASALQISQRVRALFPRVAAIVHHGGAGTTTAAALAGTPQAVVPQIDDQHYWAERVQQVGIGTEHAAGAPTAESLTHALARVLDPGVVATARAFAATVRTDGARVAARLIIEAKHAGFIEMRPT